MVKAQVPTGKRGKAGAVLFADDPDQAATVAGELLGTDVSGHRVAEVLVEECATIARELYAAVLDDSSTKGPLVLFSTSGGMDIEEVNAATPELVLAAPRRHHRGLLDSKQPASSSRAVTSTKRRATSSRRRW